MKNHFELFGLTPAFALDAPALERAYREVQAQVHPDRFAQAGDAERRASMQWATRANEAYRILSNPLERARYLLELNGIDLGFETNTAMSMEFLEQQMALREALETASAAGDPAVLDGLARRLEADRKALEAEIGVCIDRDADLAAAAERVRQLQFLSKLGGEIDAAYDAIDA